jgi:hypothetical protein
LEISYEAVSYAVLSVLLLAPLRNAQSVFPKSVLKRMCPTITAVVVIIIIIIIIIKDLVSSQLPPALSVILSTVTVDMSALYNRIECVLTCDWLLHFT